jgi:hypothetical protein
VPPHPHFAPPLVLAGSRARPCSCAGPSQAVAILINEELVPPPPLQMLTVVKPSIRAAPSIPAAITGEASPTCVVLQRRRAGVPLLLPTSSEHHRGRHPMPHARRVPRELQRPTQCSRRGPHVGVGRTQYCTAGPRADSAHWPLILFYFLNNIQICFKVQKFVQVWFEVRKL